MHRRYPELTSRLSSPWTNPDDTNQYLPLATRRAWKYVSCSGEGDVRGSMGQGLLRGTTRIGLACALAWGAGVRAQEPAPTPSPAAEVPLPTREMAQENPQANCVEPPPMARWQTTKGRSARRWARLQEGWSGNCAPAAAQTGCGPRPAPPVPGTGRHRAGPDRGTTRGFRGRHPDRAARGAGAGGGLGRDRPAGARAEASCIPGRNGKSSPTPSSITWPAGSGRGSPVSCTTWSPTTSP